VTCDAEHLRQQAIAYGAHPENTVLVQWGVDPAEFRPGLDTTSVREKWDLANQWPVLLSPRALKPNYNLDMILQAVHRLRSRYPDFVLLQPGHPATTANEYEALIVKLVQDFGLQGHVRWLGYVPEAELPLLYNLADVTLSVPMSDSTPVSMLEAMACGVPLVMTDLPSIREWITPGVNGYIVPTRDPEAIVKATVDILTAGEGWRRAAARRNRDLVLTRANRSTTLGAIEEMYTSLVNCTGGQEGKNSYKKIQTTICDALMWLQLLVELAPKMEDRLPAARIAPP
jgi:glycosyltransferase involved in cell wall biosynthesis